MPWSCLTWNSVYMAPILKATHSCRAWVKYTYKFALHLDMTTVRGHVWLKPFALLPSVIAGLHWLAEISYIPFLHCLLTTLAWSVVSFHFFYYIYQICHVYMGYRPQWQLHGLQRDSISNLNVHLAVAVTKALIVGDATKGLYFMSWPRFTGPYNCC